MARSFATSLDRVTTDAFAMATPTTFSYWMSGTPRQFSAVMTYADGAARAFAWGAGQLSFGRSFSGGFVTWVAGSLTFTGWHHYCWTHDGTTANPLLYQDGVSKTVGAQSPSGTVANSSQLLRIGGETGANTNLQSSLAFCSLNNVALTATEVLQAMLHGYAPRGLMGYWPLTGDSPEPDYSGLKRNGTVTGTTVVANPGVVPDYFIPSFFSDPPTDAASAVVARPKTLALTGVG